MRRSIRHSPARTVRYRRQDDVASIWRSRGVRKQHRQEHIMHTIVLATQKGGSGKSTLAIGLAIAARQDGHTVRLLETDPQGTISNWQRRRADGEAIVEPIN